MKTSELTGAALDWAVAKCEGMTHPEPQPMTDAEAENLSVPFYLWGTVSNKDKKGNWTTTVEKIEVVRYGVDTSIGATSPSISFVDGSGVLCRGSVGMFFKTEADAESAILYESSDHQWDEGGYSPSIDWAQGGPIIEREGITVIHIGDDWVDKWQARKGDGHWQGDLFGGSTSLISAMRCYVASKLGDTIEIPKDLN